MPHTFDDWELRQLLEDTLDEARQHYRALRAQRKVERRYPWKSPEAKADDWAKAVRHAVDAEMQSRWYESTRPTTTQTHEE